MKLFNNYYVLIVLLIHDSHVGAASYAKDILSTDLQLAFVIFRHGERVPETNEQFPTDPITIDSFFPMTYGEITREGKRRQLRLGRKLRRRYENFLSPYHRLEESVMYTTDWERTKMSALLLMAGLFPPQPSQVWDKELKWLPVPYNYKSSEHDHLIQRPDPYCPRYRKELANVFASQEVENITNKYRHVFDYVERHSGREMFDFHEMFRIFQNIHAKHVLNLHIPEWARRIYPEPLQTIASYQCVFENYNTKLRRLNGGHILQKFIQISRRKINSTLSPPGRKVFLYSGHENNIVNILAVLGLYKQHIPPYCSAVMLELHRNRATNQYGFKVYYDTDTYSGMTNQLTIPGCGKFCPFEDFLELTRDVVPRNYTAECESEVYLD